MNLNHRQRVNRILNYQPVDRIPAVAFGYWAETVDKWAREGYIRTDEAEGYKAQGDASQADRAIMNRLGFDFNWNRCAGGNSQLLPSFERQVLSRNPDGSRIERDEDGLLIQLKGGLVSIPAVVGTSLTGREAWEQEYLPRLQDAPERIDQAQLTRLAEESAGRQEPLGLFCGSLYGFVRNLLGVEALSYLAADDEELYREILDTCAGLSHRVVERVLSFGIGFDYAHYWEDICFKNGPLVRPEVFRALVGPHYQATTRLLREHGITIVSLDCDGWIDKLVPVWLENGVNTMFPIEVGTWGGSIGPWRAQYGRELRGVGGMDKRVFSQDRAAVDREIERLAPLVELGGYLPCPDHRIAPDAQFPLVAYYCERFHARF